MLGKLCMLKFVNITFLKWNRTGFILSVTFKDDSIGAWEDLCLHRDEGMGSLYDVNINPQIHLLTWSYVLSRAQSYTILPDCLLERTDARTKICTDTYKGTERYWQTNARTNTSWCICELFCIYSCVNEFT